MIIDAHGHTVAPSKVYEYQAKLIANRSPIKGPTLSDDLIATTLETHVKLLDDVGTDIQFISPRPYTMMHSLFDAAMVRRWTEYVNDLIARQCAMRPERFRGIAGLPQFRLTDLGSCLKELERCVTELGFIGCLLNPDPMEGENPAPPGLGDPFWYPLYEKMCELDVPALIHSASCSTPRESYSLHFILEESIAVAGLVNSNVLRDFPDLKIVVGHGGGAIPYQLGRFRAPYLKRAGDDSFEQRLRRLNFDTCVYSQEGLELLFKVVGPENCVFGSETPGTGSAFDPALGRSLDDLRPTIEGIVELSPADKEAIFEGNAKRLYTRAF